MNTSEVKTNIESYLTFKLGEEIFAANVTKVLNILEMLRITKIPKAPEYMKGVINLRGSVLPLVDTRLKFGMTETVITSNTCILVLEIQINDDTVKIGAMVDSVQEVLEISEDQIQPPPTLGSKIKTNFIDGMVKDGDTFIMLLNVEEIFTHEDIVNIKDITAEVSA